MDIAVWYPSPREPRDVHLDGWTIRVSKDNAAISGKYPVILVSHDAATSRLASHDLAAHLARHGFVVIAPTHPNDNVHDIGALFHAHNFVERPRHLIRALDAAAASPAVGPLMDIKRIGLLGAGFGAMTVLQLTGAAPDMAKLAAYCSPNAPLDPFCSNWAKTFHPRILREFETLLTLHGQRGFTPGFETDEEMSSIKPEDTARRQEKTPPARAAADKREKELAETSKTAISAPDVLPEDAFRARRLPVLAIGLLTPGGVSLFPDAALAALPAPVGIAAAENDTVYPPADALEKLRRLLPRPLLAFLARGANHYDLQPPCPPGHQDAFTALCGAAGPSAVEFRKARNDFFVTFFQEHLGSPEFPPPPAASKARKR